ncbi:MAG: response regulator [Acidobacteria bacterium]|nr:response regulator [Acidobacteriota bacterium]
MDARTLLVMPPERRFPLQKVLKENGLEVSAVESYREARKTIGGPSGYDLIFVDAELPDGSWEDMLQYLLDSSKPCELIVCSRCGDERLWAEVIQRGAFDLLPAPYDGREVLRIIQSALSSRYLRRFMSKAPEARAS